MREALENQAYLDRLVRKLLEVEAVHKALLLLPNQLRVQFIGPFYQIRLWKLWGRAQRGDNA